MITGYRELIIIIIIVQRFNSVLLRESFTADSRPEDDYRVIHLA